MQISFTSSKMSKLMSSDKELNKAYGKACANKIKQRLMELSAAHSMADMPAHARCHPLQGDKKGLYAVDIQHPYRLIFQPHCDDIPLKEDGGLDLKKVTAIIILSVEDYH